MSEVAPDELTFRPLTRRRWADLVRLFGPQGGCAGCWCMWWRLSGPEWQARKGAGTKRLLRALVNEGAAPGILAYREGQPIGWCAVAPRSAFPRLARSRILRPVDEKPVWSVVCLFIDSRHRRCGISVHLLRAAVAFAAQRGARIIEAYPIEPAGFYPDAFAGSGIASAFLRVGFREVARRSPTRPLMRKLMPSVKRNPDSARHIAGT